VNLTSVEGIRGLGLIAGIQLVSDKQRKELHNAGLKIPLKVANLVKEKGIIVRPLPTVGTLAISPPLTISKSEIDTLVQALTDSISSLG